MIFTDIEKAYECNTDIKTWRLCFHQPIEYIRGEKSCSTPFKTFENNDLCNLNIIIDKGIEFYQKIIRNLEQRYLKFEHQLYIDVNYYERCQKIIKAMIKESMGKVTCIRPVFQSRESKYAFMILHRCLICIGDLERYREIILDERKDQQNKFSDARHYYLKALFLVPKSSHALNQLAILSIYTKKRLDACYYYLRY